MITRKAPSWQLILADLALILFLVALSALANEAADTVQEPPIGPTRQAEEDNASRSGQAAPQIAASQALFRSSPLGPTIDEWLAEQPADPRATLTIFAQYSVRDNADEQTAVWEQAQAFAVSASRAASEKQFSIRTVITQGRTSDVYASLAFDAPNDERAQP